MKIIVVDLDGTLCNSAHRDHLAVAKLWDEFHSALKFDEPWPDIATLIRTMASSHCIIGVTGRNEKYRMQTYAWLHKHKVWIETLLMRPQFDFTSDHVLKPEMLIEELNRTGRSIDDVLFILEDRDKVVEAWRNLGLRCWQVQPGGY